MNTMLKEQLYTDHCVHCTEDNLSRLYVVCLLPVNDINHII